MKTATRFRATAGYLVGISAKLNTADTTTNPKINVTVDGHRVSSNDSGNGIQPTASWVDNSAVAIDTDYYATANKAVLEVDCVVAAGTGNAADLSVELVFVLE